jgi:putative transcriptional regulator
MNPNHHIPDEVLAEYAIGNGDSTVDLFVDCHLDVCTHCKERLKTHLDMAAAISWPASASTTPSMPVPEFDALLARLDEASLVSPQPETLALPAPREPLPDWVPRPLCAMIARQGGIKWKWVAPGIHAFKLPQLSSGFDTQLIRQRPGLVVPRHRHPGEEMTMVLTGSLTDEGDLMGPGDAVIRNPEDEHRIVINRGEVCHALYVSAGAMIPSSWFGRFLIRLLS